MKSFYKYLVYSILAFVLVVATAAQLNIPTRVFEDETKAVSIELPTEWKLVTHRDEKNLQMFITLEAHIFTVGVTVTKKANMSKIYDVKNDKAIVDLWNHGLDKAAESYHRYEIINNKKFSKGKYTGTKREVLVQYQSEINPVHMYQLVLAGNDNLIYITTVAPEDAWKEYEPVFDHSLKSLSLK